jgi:hypothetical protein
MVGVALATAIDKGPEVEVNPFESVTVNVSPDVVSATVGVPVIAPDVVFNDSPDGKVPLASTQVYVPLPPVAARLAEYDPPTTPSDKEEVVTPSVVNTVETGEDCQLSKTATTEKV